MKRPSLIGLAFLTAACLAGPAAAFASPAADDPKPPTATSPLTQKVVTPTAATAPSAPADGAKPKVETVPGGAPATPAPTPSPGSISPKLMKMQTPSVKPRVFEMRTYTPHPGKAEAMHKRFRDHTCALFQKHGIELVGFWTPIDPKDKDKLVYIVAFPSKEAGVANWKAFHDDPEWKAVYAESHKDGPLVAKVESIFLEPTDYSPVR